MQNHHQNLRGVGAYYGHMGVAQGYMPHPGYAMPVAYQQQQMHMVPHPYAAHHMQQQHHQAHQAWAASAAAAAAAAAASSAAAGKKKRGGGRKNSPGPKRNQQAANANAAAARRSIVTSKGELRFIVEAAKRRYLDAHAVLFLLEMGAKGDIQPLQKVQRRPPSGSIFLYDRSRTPQFRVDGYEYVKKKGNAAAVREDHVKLKYDHEERVYACHVHSQERESLHRRSYWDLKNRNNLILVHYWDSAVGAHETHPADCICIGCTMEIDEKVQRPPPQTAALAGHARPAGPPPIINNTARPSAVSSSSASSSSSSTKLSATKPGARLKGAPLDASAPSFSPQQKLPQIKQENTQQAQAPSSTPASNAPAPPPQNEQDDYFSAGFISATDLAPYHDADHQQQHSDENKIKLEIEAQPPMPPSTTQAPGDASKPWPHPLSDAESAAQTFDDDVAMNNFLQDGSVFELSSPRSPEFISLVDVSSLEIEDLAPDVASIHGGTKMLITLSKIGGEPFTKSNLAVIVDSVEVVFGETKGVPGDMLANGVVRCTTPPMPPDALAQVQVVVNGTPVAPRDAAAPPTVHFCLANSLGPLSVMSNLRPRLSAAVASPSGTPNSQASERRRLLKRKRSRRLPSPVPGAAYSEGEDVEDPDMDELNDEELSELSESLLERVVKVLVDLCSEENDLLGELDALDDSGFNLLHYAVAFHHVKLVTLLLNHGADPNTLTSTGDSPLHLAAEVAEVDIVDALLRAGSDVRLRDGSGQTPADLAETHGLPSLVSRLRPAGSRASVASSDDGLQKSKESLEDKQQKMLRKALASMSLKDRCALSLGVRESDVSSVTGSGSTPGHSRTSSFAGPSPDAQGASGATLASSLTSSTSHVSMMGLGGAGGSVSTPASERLEQPRESATVKQIVSEQGPHMMAVMSSLNDEERNEMEAEARVIQTNIRRWLLRRSVQATRKVQTETKGFRKEKEKEKEQAQQRLSRDDLEEKATKVQAVSKGFLARREYRQARQDVIQVQAATRCLLARKNFHAWRRQLSATLVIQRSIRERRRRIHQQESADQDGILSELHTAALEPCDILAPPESLSAGGKTAEAAADDDMFMMASALLKPTDAEIQNDMDGALQDLHGMEVEDDCIMASLSPPPLP